MSMMTMLSKYNSNVFGTLIYIKLKKSTYLQ